MANLTELGLAASRDGLNARDFSATELAEECLAEAEAAGPLNAFITDTPERTLKMAADSDARIAAGEAGLEEGERDAASDLCTESSFNAEKTSEPWCAC